VEFDQRLVDLVEFTIRAASSDEGEDSSYPNQFDSMSLERICILIAGHEAEQTASDLWARLAPLLPRLPKWCKVFFDRWFRQPRTDAESSLRFHRRWRAMIASASQLPAWGAAQERSYDLDRAWSALLGVHDSGSKLGIEADGPYLRALLEHYQHWAERCLASRSRMRAFCALLQRPGATALRLPALAWVDSALKQLELFLTSDADLVTEVVGYCVVVWYKHREDVRAQAGPRAALLSIVQLLSRMRVEAIYELKTDIELTLSDASTGH
jgi:hypothetical protein